mmetsp:Transcript_130837/g.279915  ORF Transcript_130837/g.279915 Transcript_130837/m.279915 type:complete len:96 (+) Transcript_130837:1150-1437(+)
MVGSVLDLETVLPTPALRPCNKISSSRTGGVAGGDRMGDQAAIGVSTGDQALEAHGDEEVTDGERRGLDADGSKPVTRPVWSSAGNAGTCVLPAR